MPSYVKTAYNVNATITSFVYPKAPYQNFTSRQIAQVKREEITFNQSSNIGDRVSPTAYTFNKTDYTWSYGSIITVDKTTPDLVVTTEKIGSLFSVKGEGITMVDSSYNDALAKINEQLRGTLDLSVSIAEHAATRKMLKAATTLSRYLLQIHPKHWAKHWLEYKYGWSPLVSDLYKAVEEYNKVVPELIRVKARASVNQTKSFNYIDGWDRVTGTSTKSFRTSFEILCYPSTATVNTLARFSSLNPASIAWELTPFSFVFDWFIDIGGYLRNLESSLVNSGSFRSGYFTTTSRETRSSSITGLGQVTALYSRSGSCQGQFKVSTLKRTKLLSFPFPRVPRFNAQLGASRLISAAALLRVLFIEEKRVTPKKRKITSLRINQQLRNFGRPPKRWSNDFVS